jgi:hypothetical protein
LDALLSVIDPLERIVMLEDALTPADESDADSASDEEDVVSTTPLRLLQFVDKQLIAAEKGTMDQYLGILMRKGVFWHATNMG